MRLPFFRRRKGWRGGRQRLKDEKTKRLGDKGKKCGTGAKRRWRESKRRANLKVEG
jgi:hypothetical protein